MLSFYFFNVGHGDSIAINFPDNTWGIIDCNRNINEKEPQVLKFLKRKNVKTLRFICITHPHSDHYKGIDIIVENYKNNIDKFILYGLTNNDKERDVSKSLGKAITLFAELNKRQLDKKFILIERNQTYSIGEVEMLCLNPSPKTLNSFRKKQILPSTNIEYNDVSIVLKMVYKNRTILLSGDASIKNWEEIFNEKDKYISDLIKISHHGSKENNPKQVLKKTLKEGSISVISTDGGIRYSNVPSTEVISTIESLCKTCVIKTSDLSVNKVHDLNFKDINDLDIVEAVIEATTEEYESTQYEGLIQISIDDAGNMLENKYLTLDDYFKLIN